MKEKTKRGLKVKPNITRTTLKITAGDRSGFPNDKLVQIALSGRSNVGKSSLINTLIQRTGYARVSQTPGKTITVNFYEVDGRMYIVDLPGYGFAKRPPQDKAKWSALTDSYFTQDEGKLSAVAQLIDLKVGPTEDDKLMLDFMNRQNIDYFIIATKADKLNKTEREKAEAELRKCTLIRPGSEIIVFSSHTKEGREKVLGKMFSYLR